MLSLFLRNAGLVLKIQLHHFHPAYQLLPEKPSQNSILTLQNTPSWLVFWLTAPQLP